MRNRGVRAGLTLLLCAAVLIGGIHPPALRHTHIAGDIPHDHHGSDGSHHAGGHHHAGDHEHARHHHHAGDHRTPGPQAHDPPTSHGARHERVLEPGGVAHLHITFLWFEFSVPGFEPPGPSQPGDAPDRTDSLVRLSETEAVLAVPEGVPTPFHAERLDSRTAAPAVPLLRPPSQGERTRLSSLPLCDTARHQRSGVQLI